MHRSLLALVLILVTLCFTAGAESKCSSKASYRCPNCGGTTVSDCFDCDGYLSTDTEHDMCIDRRLFQPHNSDEDDHDDHYHYLWNDLVGMFVWFFTAGVATACGVGGGGIYVPLGILLLQFAPKQASGLSQASIFGASLGGMVLNIRDVHPASNKIRDDAGHEEINEQGNSTGRHLQTINERRCQEYKANDGEYYTRPLINYDMALFLSPMEMAGAVLGVLVQKILPNWLYLLIAGLVLSFTSYKTYNKFFAVRSKEKAAAANESATSEQAPEPEPTKEDAEAVVVAKEDDDTNNSKSASEEHNADGTTNGLDGGLGNDNDNFQDTEESRSLRQDYLHQDMRQYPKEKLVALLVLWVGLILLTLFKGGKGVESLVGIDCESPWYIVLICLQFLWMFGFAIFFGHKLLQQQAARVAVRYPFQADDPIWDSESLRFYGSFTFVAGIVAGLIGIGGGMVLGPLMLVMGIHPRVSSATTATMIVLTSSSVAVIFVTSGLVPWSYAVFFFCVCFCGAYLGKCQIDGYVKRTGRASLLIFILASIIAFATLGCFVIMLTRLAEKDWCFDGFNKFCNLSPDEDDGDCALDRFLEHVVVHVR